LEYLAVGSQNKEERKGESKLPYGACCRRRPEAKKFTRSDTPCAQLTSQVGSTQPVDTGGTSAIQHKFIS